MAQTYKFQVGMYTETGLPRDVVVNTLHFQHQLGSLLPTDLDAMADSLIDLYRLKFSGASVKVNVKAYKAEAGPQPPLSDRTKGTSLATATGPREIALCLSFAGNKAKPRERGRIYLAAPLMYNSFGSRPSVAQQNWALGFYSTSNQSFPDLGGADWVFGVWSPTNQAFHKTTEAWVDDEWDTVRSRGLQPSSRVSSVRDG